MQSATVLTASVLASPGTPSRRRWPSASRPIRILRTISFCPTIVFSISARRDETKALSSRTRAVRSSRLSSLVTMIVWGLLGPMQVDGIRGAEVRDLAPDFREGRLVAAPFQGVVDPTAENAEFRFAEPARGDRGRPDPDAARDGRGPRVVRDRVLVHRDACLVERILRLGARELAPPQVDEEEM